MKLEVFAENEHASFFYNNPDHFSDNGLYISVNHAPYLNFCFQFSETVVGLA